MMNKVILPILLILFLSINELLFCQITPKSKKNYSIRFNTIGESYAEFEAIHLAPSFTITIGNEKHNFYLGPQYTYLFQHKGNWSRRYEKNSPGLNFRLSMRIINLVRLFLPETKKLLWKIPFQLERTMRLLIKFTCLPVLALVQAVDFSYLLKNLHLPVF